MIEELAKLNEGFMSLPNKFLSDLVIYTKYANFIPDEHRKQDWNECVGVLEQMHMEQYPKLTDEIAKNTDFIRNKLVLPSMRSIQFGGSPIKFAPNRMYNCAFLAIDDPFAFSEVLFLLLCGVGVGYSVQERHTSQLPTIQKPQGHRRFLIPDSIEGWSDALRALIYAYMRGKPMPRFDFCDIRAKGSIIKKTGGLAPGPDYLREALEKIQAVLEGSIGRKLIPIEVHDIICYGAESVIAGGVRTSALIALFDKTDMKMLFAKSPIRIKSPQLLEDRDKEWVVKFKLDRNQQTSVDCYNGVSEQIITIPKKNGSYDKDLLFNEGYIQWYMLHNQRSMSNNSVVFLRGGTTEDEFMEFWDMVRENKSGEPGIYWTNDYDMGTNPSLRAGTKILTKDGIFPIEKLEGELFKIKNLDGVWSTAKCFLSGRGKRLYEIKLEDGSVYYSTKEHKWPVLDRNNKFQRTHGKWIKKETANIKPGMELPLLKNTSISQSNNGNKDDGFLVGWLYGDGWISTRKSNNKIQYGMCVSIEDAENGILDRIEKTLGDRFGENVGFRFREDRQLYELCLNSKKARLFFESFGVDKKEFGIPSKMWSEVSDEFIFGFIDGLFSSDGWVFKHKNNKSIRTGFTSINKKMIDDVKELLGFYGIMSHIKESKPIGNVTFPNGITSTGNQISYQLRISHINNIQWFSSLFSLSHKSKQTKLMEYRDYLPKNNQTIKIISVTPTELFEDVWDITVYDDTHCFQLATCVTGNCGEISIRSKQFCNLTTSVVYNVQNQHQLNTLAKTSAFFGTLQAGYTDFHYLRPEWREVTQEDALLGCSMTGIASGNVLRHDLNIAAQKILEENARVADIIGINHAKRATTMKPEGTGTLAAGVLGNGIHAIHSEYFRRNMRLGKHDPIYHYLKNIMPEFVEDEFGKEKTRAVVSIPIKSPKDAIYRNESVFDLLNRIKRFSNDWVSGGHREGINKHNVSATVYVKDNEWLDVAKWMWDNRDSYAGITVLPYDGGIYKQAPFEEIDKQEYEQSLAKFPKQFNFGSISSDHTTRDHVQDPACSGGSCEITSI